MTQFEHTERLKQTADLLERTAEGLERAAANLNNVEKLVAELKERLRDRRKPQQE